MYNYIRLLHGFAYVDKRSALKHGDLIGGIDQGPKEIKRWPIDKLEEAKLELSLLKCTYTEHFDIERWEEYALEYIQVGDDGDIVAYGDYIYAEED